jgi:hypothetical protein
METLRTRPVVSLEYASESYTGGVHASTER